MSPPSSDLPLGKVRPNPKLFFLLRLSGCSAGRIKWGNRSFARGFFIIFFYSSVFHFSSFFLGAFLRVLSGPESTGLTCQRMDEMRQYCNFCYRACEWWKEGSWGGGGASRGPWGWRRRAFYSLVLWKSGREGPRMYWLLIYLNDFCLFVYE